MNNRQSNQLNMYQSVIAVLDEDNAVWTPMAPFGPALTALKNKVNGIRATAQQQETPTGAAQDKADARDDLEEVLFLTCQALAVLGYEDSDNDLLALTDVTRSSLAKIDSDRLSQLASSILAQANAKQTELATLQVTQANIDELNQALAEFNEAKTGPRQATVARSAHTDSLTTQFREANEILRDRLDPMVNILGRTNPQFASRYRSARVIVDRAATHVPKPETTPPQPTA